jgi:hypothetical protein
MAGHPVFDRHSCIFFSSFLRKQESSDFALRLSRYRQRAAYAAGVSIGCRRSSHFSLAGPREK